MNTAIRILLAIVAIEAVIGAILVTRQALRTVALIPRETLRDPLIMSDLTRLATATEKGDAESWTRLGQALVGKGFYAHAEIAFREAVARQPRSLPAQFGLAFSLDRLGRMQESSREYERTLPLRSPDDQLVHTFAIYAMGRNGLRLEQPLVAEERFRAIEEMPEAIYQLAKLRVRDGAAQAALPIIRQMLREFPDSLEFHYLHHHALRQLDRDHDASLAAANLQRGTRRLTLNFNPEYVAPLDQMTGAARLMKELDDSIDQNALLRQPEKLLQIKQQLGNEPIFAAGGIDRLLLRSAVELRQPERVFELVASRRAAGEENAELLEAEGDAWRMVGDREHAAKCWDRALSLTPSPALLRKLAEHQADTQVVDRWCQ